MKANARGRARRRQGGKYGIRLELLDLASRYVDDGVGMIAVTPLLGPGRGEYLDSWTSGSDAQVHDAGVGTKAALEGREAPQRLS